MRHAIAAARGPEWPNDDVRPLTDRGTSRFKQVVEGLAAIEVVVDEVLTSPLVRARQTADLLARGLLDHPPVKVLEALAPDHEPARVLDAVARAARGRRIALVGHEPGLGALAALLIGARRTIPFKKGGVCRIDVDSAVASTSGTLVWFATPRILRRLAE